jgi:hypothetical protein
MTLHASFRRVLKPAQGLPCPPAWLLLSCLLWGSVPGNTAYAQLANARLGIGLNTMLSSDDGLGIGFRGRMAAPINSDLSFAFDAGLTGFVFDGRRNATWIIDPQVSLIVTLEGQERAPYLLTGVGGYIPVGEDTGTEGGPAIHAGVGWIKLLRESTLFYEVIPALVVGENSVSVSIPFRIGIIF